MATGGFRPVLRSVGLIAGSSPINDAFAAAAPVTGTTFSGSTVGATVEKAEVTAGEAGAGDATVWFTWTPSKPGMAFIVPDGPTAPSVRVWTGSDLAKLSRADIPDPLGASAPTGATVIPALPATRYAIQVITPQSAGSTFSFTILQPDAGPPPNDAFAQAEPLDAAVGSAVAVPGPPVSAALGATAGATAEPGEPGAGGGSAGHSVWYRISPASGSGATLGIIATPLGLSTTPHLGVWAGADVAHLTPIAADTGGSVTFVQPGVRQVYVSVDGPEGYFRLGLAATGIGPPDTAPPVVSCSPPTGWVARASIPCTASDTGSGLARSEDASFTLLATVPAGTAASDVQSPTRTVCDKAANCTTVGPFTVKVDGAQPLLSCPPVPPGWSPVDVSVTCTAADTGSGLAPGSPPSFTLSATVPPGGVDPAASFGTHAPICDNVGNCTPVPAPPPVKIDKAPPAVACDPAPSGWISHQAAVTCRASDTGSGLAVDADATFTLTTKVVPATADPNAATNSRQVCDQVGNCTTVASITGLKVDLAPPVVSCPVPTGWHAGNSLDVACTATDTGSGLADPKDAAFVLHAKIAPGTSSGSAPTDSRRICDVAGNCTTAGPLSGVQLDDGAPVVTCAAAPAEWQSTGVSVGCTATAEGSGLANPVDAAFALSVDIPAGLESSTVGLGRRRICNSLGRCSDTPALGNVRIDHRPPQVTCEPVPGGVSSIEVDVACSATDLGSGIAVAADSAFHLRTSVGAGHADHHASTSSRRVCDAVGNCTTAGPFTADVDRTRPPPATAPTLTPPGQIGVLLAADPAHASDAFPVRYDRPGSRGGAGLVSVACDPPPGSLFGLGFTPINCAATDLADQSAESTFYLTAAAAPALAPSGPALQGARWRAVGLNYRAASPVSVELDESSLGGTNADEAGRVDDIVVIPASTPIGHHTLVVRGTDLAGRPLLVITPLVVAATAQRGETTPPPAGGTSNPPGGTSNPPGGTSNPPGGGPAPEPGSGQPGPTAPGGGGSSSPEPGSGGKPPLPGVQPPESQLPPGTATKRAQPAPGPLAPGAPRPPAGPISSPPEAPAGPTAAGGRPPTIVPATPGHLSPAPADPSRGSSESRHPDALAEGSRPRGAAKQFPWWILWIAALGAVPAGAAVLVGRRRSSGA
ncbi:MAG: hypothetical protein NVS3B12_03600 [Acidimicrobiales bacterium]